MEIIDAPDVYGYTIFCDDIRTEFDGKISFIGSYPGQIFVHGFPTVMPKFGLGITLYQRKDIFSPDMKLLIFMPGDSEDAASIQANVTEGPQQSDAPLNRATELAGILSDERPYVIARANLIVAPFTIGQPGAIKVRAVHNDKLIRLGATSVLLLPQAAT
jgi:hypothetical protein